MQNLDKILKLLKILPCIIYGIGFKNVVAVFEDYIEILSIPQHIVDELCESALARLKHSIRKHLRSTSTLLLERVLELRWITGLYSLIEAIHQWLRRCL